MKELEKVLRIREKELEKLIGIVSEELKGAPTEKLRISTCRNTVQYYLSSPEINRTYKNGKYITHEHEEIAKKIAQRDYDIRLMKRASVELEQVRKLISINQKGLEGVYENENKYRKKLINPYVLPNEIYVSKWMEEEYKGLPFAEGVAEIYTNKGERVRSKSEKIIADYLYDNNIAYKYEKPILLNNTIVHPDFTILDVENRREIYWEHFGLMDDIEYSRKAVQKIDSYIKEGLMPGERFIATYETSRNIIDTRVIKKIVECYFC